MGHHPLPRNLLPRYGSWLSGLTAGLVSVAAGITRILEPTILEVGREAGWIRARANAEAITSECFRYTAGLSDRPVQQPQRIFRAGLDPIAEQPIKRGT